MAADRGTSDKDELVLNAIFNPHNPLQAKEPLVEIEEVESTIEISNELKKLEIDAVNAAQKGELIESLNMFNILLHKVPQYPSGYNNRAQLLRIQGDNESALNDLSKAIELCNGRGFVASQAHVQRALLYKLTEDNENALLEFQKAAKLGNKFAKQQLVSMNPYAALCNRMLSEVFAKEVNPELCVL